MLTVGGGGGRTQKARKPDTLYHIKYSLVSMYMHLSVISSVVYVEACESGSMFADLLPPAARMLAVTAANTTAPSYACCYDSSVDAYLGDAFSVRQGRSLIIKLF